MAFRYVVDWRCGSSFVYGVSFGHWMVFGDVVTTGDVMVLGYGKAFGDKVVL